MGKTKHAKEEEFYKQIIRNNKKEIKRLSQRIRQLEKELGYQQNKTEEKSSKRKQDDSLCKNCGKGEIRIMDIGIRLYAICDLCKSRDRIS